MTIAPSQANAAGHSLFEPRSIAIVGASPEPTRFGGRPLANLQMHGYEGALYPINPKYSEVSGLPCYPSLASLGSSVDMALLAIPAEGVADALLECAGRQVKLAVVVSSGFAELGTDGVAMQKRAAEAASAANIRLLGPNCLGFINGPDRIPAVATAAVARAELLPGSISMVSHSGALGIVSVFVRAHDNGVGYRYLVSSGNESDLHALELMRMFVEDPKTRVIAGLVEEFRRPDELADVAQAALIAGKPIIVLKIGRSEAGRRAASAHTAALAGSDAVYDAAFRAHGIVRVDDLDELWQVPDLFASVALPAGRKVGVITTSGGLNGLVADLLHREGLEVATLSPGSIDELRHKLPKNAVAGNPLDLTGGLRNTNHEIEAFSTALKIMSADPQVHMIVLGQIAVRENYDETLSPLLDVIETLSKPVVILSPGGSISDLGIRPARRSGVPLFTSPQRCARALHHLCWYADYVRAQQPVTETRTAKQTTPISIERLNQGPQDTDATWKLLERYGLPIVHQKRCRNLAEVRAAATELTFPLAMKASNLLHKTEAKGVKLGIQDVSELERTYADFEARLGPVVHLQEMIIGGVEMIVGVQHDPNFGPVVVVGSGGVLVELISDTALATPPVSKTDAQQLIAGLKGMTLLRGFRGAPAADVDALAQIVAAVSRLSLDFAGSIESLDLNPVIVLPAGEGAAIVDAVLVGRGGI